MPRAVTPPATAPAPWVGQLGTTLQQNSRKPQGRGHHEGYRGKLCLLARPLPPSPAAGRHGGSAGCAACSTAGPPCAGGRAPASALLGEQGQGPAATASPPSSLPPALSPQCPSAPLWSPTPGFPASPCSPLVPQAPLLCDPPSAPSSPSAFTAYP